MAASDATTKRTKATTAAAAAETFGINAQLKQVKWRLDAADCKVLEENEQQDPTSSAILQIALNDRPQGGEKVVQLEVLKDQVPQLLQTVENIENAIRSIAE